MPYHKNEKKDKVMIIRVKPSMWKYLAQRALDCSTSRNELISKALVEYFDSHKP